MRRARLVPAALAALLACTACDKKKAPEASADLADAGDAGAEVHGVVVALPGCHALVAGGTELPVTPGSERSKPTCTEGALAAKSIAAGASPSELAAHACAAGRSALAAAYVVKHELRVARAGAHGEPPVRVEVLEKQNVDAVALAFEGDALHVVWSAFAPEKKRNVLRWSKWPAGGAPAAPQTIGTGVLSATQPSLAIDGGRFLLAWTEGEGSSSVVKVGASRAGLQPIPGLAGIVSRSGVPSDSPVVALEGDSLSITWVEHASGAASARAAVLKCQE